MAWYLYGVTSGDAPDAPAGDLSGIDEAEVRLLGDGDLRLIVSAIDRSVDDLQAADPEDTIAAVQRHDEVLTRIAAAAPVLPVRFGTLLTDVSAAEELLEDRLGELARALDAVAGADEWVVTVDASEATADEVAPDLPPGHAFFARKRSESGARRDARQRAEAVADALGHHLGAMARGIRPLAPREPGTVSRAAYLVDRDAADRFVTTAETADGAAVTVQGPLPPYRFAPDARSNRGGSTGTEDGT